MAKHFKPLFTKIVYIAVIASLALSLCVTASADMVSRDWLWPVPDSNRLSSCFGDGRSHNAIDIAAPEGTPVIASMSGTVVKAYTSCPYNYAKTGNCPCGGCLNLGNYVYIQHSYNGKNYISRYGHFTDVNVAVGDKVKAGDVIGTVGSTGRSTGFHLDFQIYEGSLSGFVKYIDPLKNPFLQPIEGLNANAASTSCCYTYVDEVYAILNEESDYKDDCKVESLSNYDGTALKSCSVMSMPCTSDVFSFSYKVASLSSGDEFTVFEKITNTKNEIWYYIATGDGIQGYVKSSNVFITEMSHMYSKTTASKSIAAYSGPSHSSEVSHTYSSGNTITIHGTVEDAQGSIWYVTDENTYIPYSSLGTVNPMSALKISGTPYPYDSLQQGAAYSIKGSAETENNITGLSVKITNSSGSAVISKSVSVNARSYSFRGSDLDYAIPFSTLSSGRYSFSLTITESAYDALGKRHTFSTVISVPFGVGISYETGSVTVRDDSGDTASINVSDNYSTLSKYDKITISGYNTPPTLKLGQSFSIRGNISSGETKLTKVSVSVINGEGSSVINVSSAPRSKTYSVSSLDNSVKFGSLAAGKYTYVVTATNASGTSTLVSSQFQVIDTSEPEPDPEPDPVPDSGSLENFKVIRDYNKNFTDVPTAHWYYPNVNLAYCFGIMSGISDTQFAPGASLTLAECIKIASVMHDIYYGIGTNFPSTPEWYEAYVDYALKYGIIEKEYSNYNAYATRSQVAEMFVNALPPEALVAINPIDNGDIPDISSSSPYYDAVYILYRAGIFRGSDDIGTFGPNTNILRSEISAIITRLALEDMRISFGL